MLRLLSRHLACWQMMKVISVLHFERFQRSIVPTHFRCNGTLQLLATGGFTYTPNADFSGTDTFSYLVAEGEIFWPSRLMVTITVTNPPDDDVILQAPDRIEDLTGTGRTELTLTSPPVTAKLIAEPGTFSVQTPVVFTKVDPSTLPRSGKDPTGHPLSSNR